jgi:phosphopantothenoylcysteine decarboxylase / phosphopantothenate---cysteine ligase
LTKLFPDDYDYTSVLKKREVDHVSLVRGASLFVVSPATANTIAKMAHGIADNFLTTALLATSAPILICPSMNPVMWNNTATQQNMKTLLSRGVRIMTPGEGPLACGTDGVGRLPEPEAIVAEIEKILNESEKLKGKKILVTAGGTLEPIDAVRVITNRGSGKMGRAIAEECYRMGADVTLLRSSSAVISDLPIHQVVFETAEELSDLVEKYVKNHDVLFHTAAVSDYTPTTKYDKKLDSAEAINLTLTPTSKILHHVKEWNPRILLVGFKAVYKMPEEKSIGVAQEKIRLSNADYIVVNDVGKEGIGFGVDDNEVTIISNRTKPVSIPRSSKTEIAKKLISSIFS